MAPRPRNSKGANAPLTASEPVGENEIASKQRDEVPPNRTGGSIEAKAHKARARPRGSNDKNTERFVVRNLPP